MRLSAEIVDKPGTSVEIVRMKQCVMTASNLGTKRAVRFVPACFQSRPKKVNDGEEKMKKAKKQVVVENMRRVRKKVVKKRVVARKKHP